MRKKHDAFTRIVLCLGFAALLGSAWPADAWALFQLSVSPRRGGQAVRFESAEPGGLLRNEEVTLAVTSDIGTQYRILQTVYQPLTNEFGNTIGPGAFILFSPSNPLGTLRTQLETPVGMGQTQIYSSNQAGESDEFVLVFNVRVPEEQPGGLYRTQITFSAEPVNLQAGVSPSTTTLDVQVEIRPKFRIEVLNERGARSLELGRITRDRKAARQVLAFQITSNIGTVYRVFQQLTEPLTSPAGETVEEDALRFTPSGGTEGTLPAGPNTPLPSSQTLLYTSGQWGASDRFLMEVVFAPEASQKAGLYRGTLSFRIESNSPFATRDILNVPVSVEVESIFSLDVSFDRGRDLNFGTFKPGTVEEVQERRVNLKVNSNLDQPYQITQVVPRKMSNAEGGAIPKERFQFSTAGVRSGTAPQGFRPVEEGETVIYTSDPEGTPESFFVDYTLTVPRDAKAGLYNSELKYSITTL